MEMKAKKTSKAMSIARNMSSPNIKISTDGDISGHGLALSGIALEQDHAYWEYHIKLPHKVHVDSIMFGVTTKKTSKFYRELTDKVQPEEGKFIFINRYNDVSHTKFEKSVESCDSHIETSSNLHVLGVSSDVNGTTYMRRIENLQNGDVLGVGMQQSDLPMIQFYLNGENLHDCAINRFRGTCYPSICLPESACPSEDNEGKDLKIQFITDEDEFKNKEQGEKFGSIIAARSIV